MSQLSWLWRDSFRICARPPLSGPITSAIECLSAWSGRLLRRLVALDQIQSSMEVPHDEFLGAFYVPGSKRSEHLLMVMVAPLEFRTARLQRKRNLHGRGVAEPSDCS